MGAARGNHHFGSSNFSIIQTIFQKKKKREKQYNSLDYKPFIELFVDMYIYLFFLLLPYRSLNPGLLRDPAVFTRFRHKVIENVREMPSLLVQPLTSWFTGKVYPHAGPNRTG